MADVDRLIRDLSADLVPVRRLLPPSLSALCWLGVVVMLAAALAAFADLGAIARRLQAAPDMWLAVGGSSLTAIFAAFGAFQLGRPDRSPVWALLPLPAMLLWVGASGAGCLRVWLVPGTHDAALGEAKDCLLFIVGLSLPLSALLILMLRRAYPLRPDMTAAVGGLAAAAAAATLLNFFHPYDAAATDLAVHVLAVTFVVLANRAFGGRILNIGKSRAAL